MLEALLESRIKERILLVLALNSEGYASGLAQRLGCALYTVQNQLKKLEDGGVVVSRLKGRTRIYTLNPRYAMRRELLALLQKAYEFLPEQDKETYRLRTRPRKAGKAL